MRLRNKNKLFLLGGKEASVRTKQTAMTINIGHENVFMAENGSYTKTNTDVNKL